MKPTYHFDASATKEGSCDRRLGYIVKDGLKPIGPGGKNTAIEWGLAWHKFAKEFLSAGDWQKGMAFAVDHFSKAQCPPDTLRTMGALKGACMLYADLYPYGKDPFQVLNVDGEAAVEQKFVWPINEPYYEGKHCNIMLSGTIDCLGMLNGHLPAIMDHKTTAIPKFRRETYLASYKLSWQLMFYRYVFTNAITALAPHLLDKGFGYPYCLINGVFIEKGGVEYQRSKEVIFTDHQMAQFEDELILTCVRFDEAVGSGKWQENYRACETIYGACKFFKLCSAESETLKDITREEYFLKHPYNPLEFGE